MDKKASFDFDEYIDRRNTGSIKYDFASHGKPEDTVPLWVADMDFRSPPCVGEALMQLAQANLYGYSYVDGDYFNAVHDWYSRRHNWEIKREWLLPTPGVIFGFCAAIRALTNEGDAVMVQRPVYAPFFKRVIDNRRRLINSPLVYSDNRYQLDLEDFERKIQQNGVRLFILCNPHNPGGRIWTRDELTAISEICLKRGVTVVSDEIHGDFARKGHPYTPYASISKEASEHSIICTAPSKTFNIAGLQASNIFIADPVLREEVALAIAQTGYEEINNAAIAATIAAYRGGEAWLDALMEYLEENIQTLRTCLAEKLPHIKLMEPDGTYLAWLNCAELGLTADELDARLTNAGVWLNRGDVFGVEGEQFLRINLACPRATLVKGLERLVVALGR